MKKRHIMGLDSSSISLVLVDGSSYLFRAYHALPTLTTSSGAHSGAVRGVISMLRRLLSDYPSSKVCVVFDAKGKTFRHDMYPDYKANRPPMPAELAEQIEPIHKIVRAMGLPLVVIKGVEADDVIGTLASQASEKKISTLISTGDKDMTQLVNDHVQLVNTMSGEFLDSDAVKEKFGVPPDRIIDYLALVGDSADNIPGVPKVGPKTAVKWLNEYDSLNGVMANADEIKGKVGENLRASLDHLPLSYDLATIKLNVELPISPADLPDVKPDLHELESLFKTLEFKSWLNELNKAEIVGEDKLEQKETEDRNYQVILEADVFSVWLEKLDTSPIFAFDIETTSLDYMEAKLVGLSIAVTPFEAAYIPVGHDYLGAPEQLALDTVLDALRPYLEDRSVKKLGQNLKYDMNVLKNYGIDLSGVAEDTMLQSYIINSTTRHDLDSLALRYMNEITIHFEDVAGKGAKQLSFNDVDLEQAVPYAAEDADVALRLFQHFAPMLKNEPKLDTVYREIEIPLIPILSNIERHGALVDANLLYAQSGELADRMEVLQKQVYELAGEEFNLGSPKQLQKIFYEKLELPILKKTPKGQPSTAEPVLQELALDYPLPKLILEFRSLSKLKSTYTDKLPLQINPQSGRIHTSYHQAVTATGRLSSSDPNLQNIPIRTKEGRRIRQAFVAPKGYKLVAADYSQIELRIMAHLSGDKSLKRAFDEDLDVHRATASEVFGVDLQQVTADQRRSAKAINFGLIYGMSAFGLGRQLNISRKEAQSYIDLYFDRYPGVSDYMNEIKERAASAGYVETLYGRRLYLPNIRAGNGMLRQAAERTAINAPMQGTAADIIKKAMISVDEWLHSSQLDAVMIMQVHDELVLEVKEDQVDATSSGLVKCMSEAAELDVPLKVDLGVGNNWDEAH